VPAFGQANGVAAPYCYDDQQESEQENLNYSRSIHGIFLGFTRVDAGNRKMMLRQRLKEQTTNYLVEYLSAVEKANWEICFVCKFRRLSIMAERGGFEPPIPVLPG
jgi:hypothetical protein